MPAEYNEEHLDGKKLQECAQLLLKSGH